MAETFFIPSSSTSSKMEMQEDVMAMMRRVVKKLHFGLELKEMMEAVEEISERLLDDDEEGRRRTVKMLGELGVVPRLVDLLVGKAMDGGQRRLVAGVLVDVANGSFTNKLLILKSGLLSRLPNPVDLHDFSWNQELASLLFSTSLLAKTSFAFNSHPLVWYIVKILNAPGVPDKMKVTCLATIHNFSRKLENSRALISSGVVHSLIALSLAKSTSEEALAILSNLMLSSVGKKAIEDESVVVESLMEVVSWDDKSKCQEHALYILMILAHGSSTLRNKMVDLGIVPLLLEVALLGSPLAQKRAIKMLQCFKNERKGKRAHSISQPERIVKPSSSAVRDESAKGFKKAVEKMVKQSFDKSMESMVRRATVSEYSCNAKLKNGFF